MMAAARTKKTEVDEDVEAIQNGNDADGTSRISFSCDAATRRNIRIAAAYADLDTGAWIAKVLNHYAEKAVKAAGEEE